MNRGRFIGQQVNNIYVNSTIYNETEKEIRAEYQTTFTTPLLEDSGHYYMTIVRFEIPNVLPIFQFVEDKYHITLSYNNIDYTTALLMNNVDVSTSSKNIYTFQQFVDVINEGFITAFNNLKTANPGSPPTEAPFIVFNPESDLFSLYVQQLYNPVVAGADTIEIFFNYDLYSFFGNSFKVNNLGINANKKDFKFIVSNERNNIPISPANYYEIKQQITTLYQWYDFQSIVFTSATLPIQSEFITSKNSNGSSIYQPIITDFIPSLGKDRSAFIYNANPVRLVDMKGHEKIYKFDFRVFYFNKNGDLRPLIIPPKYSMSVKFGFIRKENYQNYYI